jgi:hypothetical protein
VPVRRLKSPYLYADAIGLTSKEIAAIGHVAVESAAFERLLDDGIQTWRPGSKVRPHLGLKLEFLCEILLESLRGQPAEQKVRMFRGKWKRLVDERNVWIHGRWILVREPLGYSPVVTDKRKPAHEVSAAAATHTARALADAQRDLMSLAIQVGMPIER